MSPKAIFARRSVAPVAPVPAPQPQARARRVDLRLAALGAAALFLATGATAVLALGDPHAGAPRARAAIAAPPGHAEPAGWRAALSPEPPGPAPVSFDTLELVDAGSGGVAAVPPAANADASPAGQIGEAVITMADGSAVTGAGVSRALTPLAPAPIAGFSAPGPNGPLPVIAPGGRTPFQAYRRPWQDAGRPKVAIIIGGLGMNAEYTRAAIERLPPEVTLSFVPYADNLQSWIDQARAHGHEVLLELPMEPQDFPANDPGPYTLMADAQPAETTRRLEWLLGRATGYMGVTNYLGGRFLQGGTGLGLVAQQLRTRGVAMFDDGTARGRASAPGLPRASADRVIDDQQSADTIDAALLQLEARALQNGQALGTGFAYPVTLDQVARWAAGVGGRGYQLAPASAIARG